jgi:RimJ/RimL family protein N-acetyltransferase
VGRVAARLTNKIAYEEFGAHKVYGRIPATNEAAKKAVIYNGWKQEGVLRRHVRHGDELVDVELWGGFPEDQPDPPDEG